MLGVITSLLPVMPIVDTSLAVTFLIDLGVDFALVDLFWSVCSSSFLYVGLLFTFVLLPVVTGLTAFIFLITWSCKVLNLRCNLLQFLHMFSEQFTQYFTAVFVLLPPFWQGSHSIPIMPVNT
jgi:hypothetical protein